ncbi:hypothetical protein [Azospirillum largimobile]
MHPTNRQHEFSSCAERAVHHITSEELPLLRPLLSDPDIVEQWDLGRTGADGYHLNVAGHYYFGRAALVLSKVDVFTTVTLGNNLPARLAGGQPFAQADQELAYHAALVRAAEPSRHP